MNKLIFALAVIAGSFTAAHAEEAIPDLRGTWSGKGR